MASRSKAAVVRAVRERLFALADPGFRDFQASLVPTVPPERMIGVRTPALRALAREMADTPEAELFLEALPHRYHEENQLHGFLVGGGKDFAKTVERLDRFLPFVDNWATCDTICPRLFARRADELLPAVDRWLASPHLYAVRFGVVALMSFFLDDAFSPEILRRAAAVKRDDYYAKTAVAWFFATALAKRWDEALPWVAGKRLDAETRRMAIRKGIESFRIPPERKEELRKLAVVRPRASRGRRARRGRSAP